ncbi:hypothetical protein NE237_018840 [Protea cynaroides]|uniref:Endonuclease/exonuclease/phosphatase domain-containing protein n=1 Tax=Protea cynaroides TaxID=273540 RepID=A0A9Q0KAV0_9MAGN|nr:hypothetical protein NE237_018840 [Protea cynaroides]
MKILSWNCQGLGSSPTIRALFNLLRQKHLDIVFLMETSLTQRKIDHLFQHSNFSQSFIVDPQ